MKYTNCLACKELRESNDDADLALATKCRDCDGKGVVRAPESYLCNNCGDSLIPLDMEKDCKPSPYGLVEKTVSGGYFSDYLWDCTTYTFSLCEKCLRNLFDQFKIPPQIGGYMGGGAETYEEDSFYHQERLWRKAGGRLEKLKQGLCNARSACQNPAIYRIFCSSSITDECCCEEHKTNQCLNYEFIPFTLVNGDFKYENATKEQKEEILNSYFLQNSKPDKVIHYRYIPDIVNHSSSLNIDNEENKYQLIFFTNNLLHSDLSNKLQNIRSEAAESFSLKDGDVIIFEKNKFPNISNESFVRDYLAYYGERINSEE